MKKLTWIENKLALKLAKQLQKDILNRYHNSEYWNYAIVEAFKQDEQLTDKQTVKLYDFLLRTIG